MPTIRNAILNWADTPGVEIQDLTDCQIAIHTPWGSAIITLKGNECEIESDSERLKSKIDEIIERALAEEKAIWLRGRKLYDWLRGP